MGIITLEFDNTLEHSEIIMPIMSSSVAESGDSYHDSGLTDKAQTSVFGIQVPLIMINSTVINFDAIKYFSLKSIGRTPELSIIVEDRYELINTLDKIGLDNEVRIQILPRFDNAYKKINLTFYISNVRVNGSNIQLTAIYKLPKLLSTEFKSYGNINTYNLFKNIATETGLGFATNISDSMDARYVYCNNMSLLNLMDDEIQYSAAPDTIIDWWIDLWNNINLVDIRERYEHVDSDEDLKIWIANQIYEVTVDNETTPELVTAVINDYPAFAMSELFVNKYVTNLNPGAQALNGSDKVYSIYNESIEEQVDCLVQDGDIKKDIFTVFEYIGENIGEYNYMLSKRLRTGFLQKINSESISVTLQSPLLGLMRGHKVNFIHYINDDKIENRLKSLESQGIINRNVESNISLSDYELQNDDKEYVYDGKFVVDRTVSGQYLITGINIIYANNKWEYILTLTKPASTKPNIINE